MVKQKKGEEQNKGSNIIQVTMQANFLLSEAPKKLLDVQLLKTLKLEKVAEKVPKEAVAAVAVASLVPAVLLRTGGFACMFGEAAIDAGEGLGLANHHSLCSWCETSMRKSLIRNLRPLEKTHRLFFRSVQN